MATVFKNNRPPEIQGRILPIIDLAPDLDPITPGAMTDCINLYPTWKGWRTYPSLVKFTDSVGGKSSGSLITDHPQISALISMMAPSITLSLTDHPQISALIRPRVSGELLDHPQMSATQVGCPEDTIPTGTQSMSQLFCYNYDTGEPPGTLLVGSASQVNFIAAKSPNEEFIATVGTPSGFAAPYPRADWQVIHAVGSVLSAATPVPLPPGDVFNYATQTAQQGTSGQSDEMSYLILGTYTPSGGADFGASQVYFSWPSQTVTVMSIFHCDFGGLGTWAKHGINFYRVGDTGRVYRWDLTAGFWSDFVTSVVVAPRVLDSLQATDNFLWGFDLVNSTLYKLNPLTLATIATYSVIGWNAYVVSDDLIYLFRAASGPFEFSYFIPSTNTQTTITSVTSTCMSAGGGDAPSVMVFNAGYFYISQGNTISGPGGLTVKIGPLVCPGTDIPIGSI